MNESKKIIIGIGAIVIICICALGVSFFALRQFGKKIESMANTDPATTIANAEKDIAKFEVPSGYRPIGVSFMGYNMVNLMPENSSSDMTIMLMQYNGILTGSPEQIEEQLRQVAEQQNGTQTTSMQVVEVREETIRGETVLVNISEGNFQGFIMRQWMTVFQGNKGPTILMVQGPVELWDDELLENFIESIE